jgi:hypothetical protein
MVVLWVGPVYAQVSICVPLALDISASVWTWRKIRQLLMRCSLVVSVVYCVANVMIPLSFARMRAGKCWWWKVIFALIVCRYSLVMSSQGDCR